MLIGILETGHAPDTLRAAHGTYPEMFEKLLSGRGFEFRTWSVVDMDFPADVHQADGWLITGSRFGAYDDLPFIAPLETFIRDAHAAGIPMVGVCFGHQIIAQAMGGKVEKFGGGWSVGPRRYCIAGHDFMLHAWHQDQVVAPPEGATVIGESDFCRYAAMTYGDWALTVQPHPEYDASFIQGLIRTRGKGVVPDPLLNDAQARLALPTDSEAMAEMIADFFLKPREAAHG